MEWLLQNEVKRLATESRFQLLQSEKKVRNAIHALRERIEVCVRAAERSLLQDLQGIVEKQEQKIDNLENTALASLSKQEQGEKSSVIMEPLAFESAIVTLAPNDNLECLLTECSSLGVVKLESSETQTNTSMFSSLKSHLDRCFGSQSGTSTNSNGYVIGRVVPTHTLSERLVETGPLAHAKAGSVDSLENGYSAVNKTSDKISNETNEELVARVEKEIPIKVGRRRKNVDRKTATLLLNESQILDDICHEQINNDDDGVDRAVVHITCSDVTRDGEDYASFKPHKPDNAVVEYLNEPRIYDTMNTYDNVGFCLRRSTACHSGVLVRPVSRCSFTQNEVPTNPRNCRGRKRYKCPMENSVGETESGRGLTNSDVYSDVFVVLPCDLFGH